MEGLECQAQEFGFYSASSNRLSKQRSPATGQGDSIHDRIREANPGDGEGRFLDAKRLGILPLHHSASFPLALPLSWTRSLQPSRQQYFVNGRNFWKSKGIKQQSSPQQPWLPHFWTNNWQLTSPGTNSSLFRSRFFQTKESWVTESYQSTMPSTDS